MAYCFKCGTEIADEMAYCPKCGAEIANGCNISPVPEQQSQQATNQPVPEVQLGVPNANGEIICPNCKNVNIVGGSFCKYCGKNLYKQSIINKDEVDKAVKQAKNKLDDFSSSLKSLDYKKKKNYKVAGIIAAVLVVLLIFVSNIHKCEECEKVYFGKQYKISFLGESEKVCKDCYEDYYEDWW